MHNASYLIMISLYTRSTEYYILTIVSDAIVIVYSTTHCAVTFTVDLELVNNLA